MMARNIFTFYQSIKGGVGQGGGCCRLILLHVFDLQLVYDLLKQKKKSF